MTKPFQKAMLITSIIYLVVGLVLIIWPDAARQIIIYAIGAAALIYGVYRIIDFFVRNEHLSGTIQLGVARANGDVEGANRNGVERPCFGKSRKICIIFD